MPDNTFVREETLFKVQEALIKCKFFPSEIDDIINAILNSGVVFREVNPEKVSKWIPRIKKLPARLAVAHNIATIKVPRSWC